MAISVGDPKKGWDFYSWRVEVERVRSKKLEHRLLMANASRGAGVPIWWTPTHNMLSYAEIVYVNRTKSPLGNVEKKGTAI